MLCSMNASFIFSWMKILFFILGVETETGWVESWKSKGTPAKPHTPGNKALRPYLGMMVVNNPLLYKALFLGGGGIGGVLLDFHAFSRTTKS